jgi:hypothetical protein
MLGHTLLHIAPRQFFHISTYPLGRGRDYFFITHRFQTGNLLLLCGFLRLLFGVKFRFALGFSRLMLRTLFFFIFCGGLLAVFVVFVILYMAGVNQWVCIGFGVAAATLLVWLTFRLNARYGTHGLMKAAARRRHPRYVVNRLKIPRLFTFKHWQE